MSSPRSPDLSDPLQVAVEVTEIKGSLALMKEQLSTGLGSLSKAIDSLQNEQRQTTKIMIEVSRHQQAMEATSEGLSRAFNAIEKLANEFSGWRTAHEKKNDETDDHVTAFRGSLRGVGWTIGLITLLGGAVISLALYSYRNDLRSVSDSVTRLETKHDKDVSTINARIERDENLHQFK